MTPAITHNDTSISLLVTNSYYDDRIIAISVYLCSVIKIDWACSAL